MRRISLLISILVLFGFTLTALAEDLTDITNYREYSAAFSSSGQPTEAQLKTLQENDFERIIYLAFGDHGSSLAGEDRIVKDLGIDYVNIPVQFNAPTKSEFYIFAAVMAQAPDKRTLLHCQVNLRASTFSFLYRVIYQNVSLEDAKEDMNSVWAPNETWRALAFEILQDNGISPHCDVCDWESK